MPKVQKTLQKQKRIILNQQKTIQRRKKIMLMQSKQPDWRQQELAQPWKGSTKLWNVPRKQQMLLRTPCARFWMSIIPPWIQSKLICRIKSVLQINLMVEMT